MVAQFGRRGQFGKRAAGLETHPTTLGSIWGLGTSIGRQEIFPWSGGYRRAVVSLSVQGRVRGRGLSLCGQTKSPQC